MDAEQIREAIAVYRESLQTIPLDDVEKVVLEAAEAHAANLERWESEEFQTKVLNVARSLTMGVGGVAGAGTR
jgi:hypothetical protein